MFKNWTDVVAGKMTLREISNEVAFQMLHRSPKRLIIDIQRRKNGIYTKIWISNKDFKKWR
jgi:hypothetical protein